jgi:hypothetical protein
LGKDGMTILTRFSDCKLFVMLNYNDYTGLNVGMTVDSDKVCGMNKMLPTSDTVSELAWPQSES